MLTLVVMVISAAAIRWADTATDMAMDMVVEVDAVINMDTVVAVDMDVAGKFRVSKRAIL